MSSENFPTLAKLLSPTGMKTLKKMILFLALWFITGAILSRTLFIKWTDGMMLFFASLASATLVAFLWSKVSRKFDL